MTLTPRLALAYVEAAEARYKAKLKAKHRQLEDMVAGYMPDMGVAQEGSDTETYSRNVGSLQTNVNLMLPAQQFMLALAYDDFPSLRFATQPDISSALARATERAIEAAMDEGGAVDACRDSMRSCMTRGAWIVEVGIGPDRPSGPNLLAGQINPADIVAAAANGLEVSVPEGIDYEALAAAARKLLTDPAWSLGADEMTRARVTALAQTADALLAKDQKQPHAMREDRRRLWYTPLRYGSDVVWEQVTDRRDITWVARRHVMTDAQLDADPLFTAEAKREMKAAVRAVNNERGSEDFSTVTYNEMSEDEKASVNGRHVVWCVWHLPTWTRHYVSTCGYDGFLENDDGAYPYMDRSGRPVFHDFFPFVVVVPITHDREVPERTVGIGQLESGIQAQMEVNKTTTAYLQACEESFRCLLLGPGVDDEEFAEIEAAPDMTIFKPKKGATDPKEVFINEFKSSPAPVDYLHARQLSVADFGVQVGITALSLTGDPAQPTLGQDQIAQSGAQARQGDIIRMYEKGFALLAQKSLALMRAFMTDTQLKMLLGPEINKPVTRMVDDPATGQKVEMPVWIQPPGVDPMTGAPTDGVPMTRWHEWAAADLTSRRLMCRFASGTRADDAVRQKQLTDAVTLAHTVRDAMNMPYLDLRDLLFTVFKALDVEAQEYKPTAADLMMAMSAMAPKQEPGKGGEDREAPNGGREDGRKAGGERGAPAIPGQQSRGRAPMTRQHMDGRANRAGSPRI